MIVYVKVRPDKHPIGATPRQMAWRAWRLGRLLVDPNFRNSKKILVVLSGGHVIATFCIHGVALDTPLPTGNLVRFALEDTTLICHNAIVAYMAALTPAQKRSIKYTSCGYISTPGFNPNCPCILNIIPEYPTNLIQNGELVG